MAADMTKRIERMGTLQTQEGRGKDRKQGCGADDRGGGVEVVVE